MNFIVKLWVAFSPLSSYDTTQDHIDKMNEMYDFVADWEKKFDGGSDSEIFPMAGAYADYILMEIITGELVRNILLALLCVFLATLFLIADLFCSLIVVLSVTLALIDVGGFMFFWGLSIETVAASLGTLALGLTVDYSAHVAHAFMVEKGTREERIHQALIDMGPAVLNGGFSTFLAFAMLMSSQSFVFLIFFKIFFLVVIFGLYHGLVFLPCLLSFIGPSSITDAIEDHGSNSVSPVPGVTRVQSATYSVRAKSAYSKSRAKEAAAGK